MFFTDATGPCYHTIDDEVAVVDFSKLEQEIATGRPASTQFLPPRLYLNTGTTAAFAYDSQGFTARNGKGYAVYRADDTLIHKKVGLQIF